ncbi:phosphatase PAP2 family protein [Novosphingobium sp.]|uniref:acid phosphatase n=1 Tax=Novosphingobium sp. TaxID=1874826 RepID=UPI001ED61841|nr:phosphatase PAP2 family protein [Novosphingobium sp.]MBK6802285.1 phosphatase PAP2 family protein [Novosphingobium sp.]MBK9009659.1 phosphatase PAP2 family protein [Novosphingobium sp.]
MRTSLLAALALALTAPGLAADAPTAQARLGKGYLDPAALPDSLTLLPPPPAPGSAAEARDREAASASLAQRGSGRWQLAARDADLFSPAATGAFSCAAGIEIGPKTTPRLDALLRKTLPDLGLATYAAKTRYQRTRPFVVNGEANCTPEASAILAKDGSYPSGHAAIGYGWGLILAELVPARATRLAARGREFADSRRVCNVHWLSDVEAGAVIGAATVARLHAEPQFRKDLDAARKELRRARAVSAAACPA